MSVNARLHHNNQTTAGILKPRAKLVVQDNGAPVSVIITTDRGKMGFQVTNYLLICLNSPFSIFLL
ncbi:MAG: hypothetical protein ACFFB5_05510 [Promethearchaeota archaeon]